MNKRQKNRTLVNYLRKTAKQENDFANLPIVIREARIFQYILENIPIFYQAGDYFAGDYGWHETTAEEVDAFLKKTEEALSEKPPVTYSQEQLMGQLFSCKGNYTSAHTCINYEKLLTLGISGILEEVYASKKKAASNHQDFYQAVEIALKAFLKFCDRFVVQLEKHLETTTNESVKLLLKQTIDNCRNVPEKPATNFPEALQSIWFVHMVIGISEYNDASISLGRLDQFAYECFQNTANTPNGQKITENWLNKFWKKLNCYGDAACAVNLGGLDKDGKDLCNPLTYLITETVKKNSMPSPILAARIHPEIPQDLFDLLTDEELFKQGQPTFYGENSCLLALRKRNIPESDIFKWAANSCMGLVVQGYEISDMWGAVVNCMLPLELALNNGRPFSHDLPISLNTKANDKFNDFQSLVDKVEEYLYEIIKFCINANQKSLKNYSHESPNPYISAFLDDCIKLGEDRVAGGARYFTVIVEAFALVNVADALQTIKTLVFEKQKYSLNELIDIAKNNFKGNEKLLKEIQTLPKYGDADPETDRLVAELAQTFASQVDKYTNGNKVFAPSFHTLAGHIGAGKLYGASLDGRLEGEPFAKNIGTSPGTARKELTSLIKSATTIDQSDFGGGQPLDISVDCSMLTSKEGKRKFQSLLQSYFKLGGLQMQVNGLSAETLQKAIKEPEKYNDLVVRIGGYSEYFNRLSNDIKHEMVKRFSSGI